MRRADEYEEWWQTVGQYAAEPPAWTRLYDTNRNPNMKITDLLTSKYLKQADVPEPTTVTVAGLKKVNVAREDEAPEYKFTIKFEEFDKPMVLNATNIKRLGKALGDDVDDWMGGKVTLYVDDTIEFGGEIKGGLRIRPVQRAATKPKRMNDDDFNSAMNSDDDNSIPF